MVVAPYVDAGRRLFYAPVPQGPESAIAPLSDELSGEFSAWLGSIGMPATAICAERGRRPRLASAGPNERQHGGVELSMKLATRWARGDPCVAEAVKCGHSVQFSHREDNPCSSSVAALRSCVSFARQAVKPTLQPTAF